jgi:hypothetical protein
VENSVRKCKIVDTIERNTSSKDAGPLGGASRRTEVRKKESASAARSGTVLG